MFFELGVVNIVVNFFVFDFAAAVNSTSNYGYIPCKVDSDCTLYGGVCTGPFCKCNNSFNCKLSKDHTLVNKLEETCQSSSDCNMDYAFCNDRNRCMCQEGYSSSENKKKCLRIANSLGERCEESVQCYSKISSSECQNDICVCLSHMHEYNGSCYKNVGLGETCQLIGECSMISHSTCIKNKCQCTENYVPNDSSCLLKANGVNFTCSADVQCRAQLGLGSECSNGFCQCKEVFHFKASKNMCVHDILLNEECGDHRDCHQPGTGPSKLECLLGICKCKAPYLEEGGFCINSSTSVVFIRSIMLFLGTMFLVM